MCLTHLEAELAGATRAEAEGCRVAEQRRVDVKRSDQLLARRAAATGMKQDT